MNLQDKQSPGHLNSAFGSPSIERQTSTKVSTPIESGVWRLLKVDSLWEIYLQNSNSNVQHKCPGHNKIIMEAPIPPQAPVPATVKKSLS